MAAQSRNSIRPRKSADLSKSLLTTSSSSRSTLSSLKSSKSSTRRSHFEGLSAPPDRATIRAAMITPKSTSAAECGSPSDSSQMRSRSETPSNLAVCNTADTPSRHSPGTAESVSSAEKPMSSGSRGTPQWPRSWTPGELLNVRKFSDGNYRITRLDEEFSMEKQNGLILSHDDCQKFVSEWYACRATMYAILGNI